MNVKKCTIEKIPPREVDVCEVMRKAKRRHAVEKAGKACCPEPEAPVPVQPPDCFGLCIEKIKNPNLTTASKTSVIRCKSIPRVPPGSEICDELKKTLRAAMEEY